MTSGKDMIATISNYNEFEHPSPEESKALKNNANMNVIMS